LDVSSLRRHGILDLSSLRHDSGVEFRDSMLIDSAAAVGIC
jgi:hypothetical protein